MPKGSRHGGAATWTRIGELFGITACPRTLCRRSGALPAYDLEGEPVAVAGSTQVCTRVGKDERALALVVRRARARVSARRGLRLAEDGRRRMPVTVRLADVLAVAELPNDRFANLPADNRTVQGVRAQDHDGGHRADRRSDWPRIRLPLEGWRHVRTFPQSPSDGRKRPDRRARRPALGPASSVRLGGAVIGSGLALVAAGGLAGCVVSPPRLLSLLDAADGGGAGVAFAGSRTFGTHGQRLNVWRPTRAAKRLPIVVFFYGGGWVKGTRAGYAFAGKAFANRGFVTVVPDYRKVPGVRFPAFLQDGAEAVRWARDHAAEFGGDPARIAVAGHSAGAYTAVMLALDPRWLHAEGMPPNAIKAAVGLSGPYDFYPFTSERAVAAFADAADPHATQPITFARTDAPPMLLVTSTGDTVVKPRNSEALAARLSALGAPVALRVYPGLSHEAVAMALSKPFRGKGPVLADSAAFLHANLGS